MIRGGDTPKQETLWAIEFESGKFAFGHANENQIFVATSGIGRQIWYADGGGVVEGYTESVDEITDTLIDTFNEHFGTNISHLTPDTELFEVGGTVPNWNSYEKILLPEIVNFRFVPGSGTANLAGFMQGDKAYINSASESSVWNVSPEGQVWGPGGQASLYEQQAKNLLLSNFGREISEVLPFVVEWQQGSQVPNWESYTLLS